MKEKKNKKEIQSQTGEPMPSKNKIMAAWILLIVLVICAGGLTYLKVTYKDEEVVDKESENENTLSPTIIAVLTEITDNFNNNSLIIEYQGEGLTLSAVLEDDTIVVTYSTDTDNGTLNYKYNTANAQAYLTVDVLTEQDEINQKAYRIMVLACREWKGLTADVTEKLDKFFNGEGVNGLLKETTDTGFKYSISLVSPAEDIEELTPTSETSTTENEENKEENNTNVGTVDNNNNTNNTTNNSNNSSNSNNNNQTSSGDTTNNQNNNQDNNTSQVEPTPEENNNDTSEVQE